MGVPQGFMALKNSLCSQVLQDTALLYDIRGQDSLISAVCTVRGSFRSRLGATYLSLIKVYELYSVQYEFSKISNKRSLN